MLNSILNIIFSKRLKQIDKIRLNPEEVQHTAFKRLLNNLVYTDYGKSVGIKDSDTYQDFASKVPVNTYEDYQSWIEKSFEKTQGTISSDNILWYSKSSGTTSSQSKFLPVTQRYLQWGHLQGGRDVLALLMDNYPHNSVLSGKTLTLGGSLETRSNNGNSYVCGDISAIMMSNTPWYAKYSRVPKSETAIIPDFNEKVEKICKECSSKNVTAFAGVPSWNMVMLERLLKYNNKNTVPELWKNIELFIHGGVSFEPYREQYKQLFPNPNMKYIETYNASEGFFGIQDNPLTQDMLLMLDYDIFYEFMPMSKFGNESAIVPIEGVEKGVNYAMIISTSAGLWRYMIGDTVEFTSLKPHRIKITGRTKLFLNVFGEEVIVENCDKAIVEACKQCDCAVKEYMVSPIFMEVGSKGAHQWIVEFSKEPTDKKLFTEIIDKTIQSLNSDYQAKRNNNTTLNEPEFLFVKEGAFYQWYGSKGKLGGQNKIPRLSNNRDLSEEFIIFAKKNNLF